MKKKLLIVLFALVAAICCAFGFAGCFETETEQPDAQTGNGGNGSNTNSSEQNNTQQGGTNSSDSGSDNTNNNGDNEEHKWGEWRVIFPANCSQQGLEGRICKSELHPEHMETRETAINPTAHDYSDWQVTTSATCSEKGEETRTCKINSSHKETRDVAINPAAHQLNHFEAQAPTCTKIGWKAYDTCSRCNYSTYVELPAKGHTASEWKTDEEATCILNGSKHKECTVCHITLETEVINKLGHNLVPHKAQAPTCTEIGWDTYNTCSRCNYTTYAEISATGHTESEWKTDEEATCTVDGSKHKECTVCHVTLETEAIDKLGHNIVKDPAVKATCSATGLTEGSHCDRCSMVVVEQKVTSKLSHSFGSWTITKKATNLEEGSKYRTCSLCRHVETQSIAKITACKVSTKLSITLFKDFNTKPYVSKVLIEEDGTSYKVSVTVSWNIVSGGVFLLKATMASFSYRQEVDVFNAGPGSKTIVFSGVKAGSYTMAIEVAPFSL